MERLKKFRFFLALPALCIGGLFIYFVFSTFLAPRFSALGACDTDSGCLYTAFNGNRSVRVIGFSADGTRFLTDGTSDAIIHDADTGRNTADLDEGTDNHSYSISGDRQEIVAYNTDSIKFFDWEGERLRTWTADPDESVRDVALVPFLDGFVIAEAAGVSLWRMSDGSLINRLTETGGIMDVSASADGRYVAAYNFVDDQLIIWPLENVDAAVTINNVEALYMDLSADGSRIAAQGPSGAFVWNTADGSLITSLETNGTPATAASLSADGNLLAVGFENGSVTVLDIALDQIVSSFDHAHPPNDISIDPDNNSMAVGLDHEATQSNNELVFRDRPGYQHGENLRANPNSVQIRPGYLIMWRLSPEP